MSNKRNYYFLIFLIVIKCVKENQAICNTFSKTEAKIKIQGKYQYTVLNGCLEDSDIAEVWITGCLKNIQPGTFNNMNKLEDITIEAGNLEIISPNFTLNTPVLKNIAINMNALRKINKDVFPKNPLTRLCLASNKISSIEEGAFKNMIVDDLILNDNKIKNIESKWFGNTKIRNLHVEGNQINHIRFNAFSRIRGLQEINLSNNLINYIDSKAFFHQKTLRNLNLTENMLTHLNFLDNIKLTKLDVGFNRISYISLSNRTSIQYFFVFPNPWQCNCLQEFWKFAVKQNIGVGNTPSTKSTWRDVYPVCVAQNIHCNKKQNYDEIRQQYFKNVNYAKLDN